MNGWKHIALTIILSALAAFGGLQAGAAQRSESIRLMEKRMDRIEDKIDWLIDYQVRRNEAQR